MVVCEEYLILHHDGVVGYWHLKKLGAPSALKTKATRLKNPIKHPKPRQRANTHLISLILTKSLVLHHVILRPGAT
jgi:hypothetical protein